MTTRRTSTTARQLVELGLAGGAGMLASGGNLTDPKTLMVAALTYGARRGQVAADQRMARRIAEMLVSQNPALVQQATRRAAQHPGIMNALRQFSGALAGGARAVAGGTAGAGMAQGQPAN